MRLNRRLRDGAKVLLLLLIAVIAGGTLSMLLYALQRHH